MPSSDITMHRALVVRSLATEVYVKIPTVLGANETITLYKPVSVGADWPPSEGDQILVAVEGENFNRVYLVSNITDTSTTSTSSSIDGGTA
jgi:hypothetical protein